MKTLLILFVFTATGLWGQPNFSAVIDAIQSGNANSVAPYLSNEVEITIGDNDGTYNKSNAISTLQQFFSGKQPKVCSTVHSGAARDQGAYYCIGKMKASDGSSYRIYVYFKKEGASYLIREIRFEEN
jgi:hypothetical protein